MRIGLPRIAAASTKTIIAAIERVIAIVSVAKDCPKADSG
jgi:hypothetical protein